MNQGTGYDDLQTHIPELETPVIEWRVSRRVPDMGKSV